MLTPALQILSSTQWTVRHASTNSILLHSEILLTAFEAIQKGHDEYAAQANSMIICEWICLIIFLV